MRKPFAPFVFGVLALGVSCSDPGPAGENSNENWSEVSLKRCGNGVCSGNEKCSTCPQDCGPCPSADAGTSDSGGGSDTGSSHPVVGPQASISCPAGAVNISPGEDIGAIVNSYGSGTTFCILAGTHTPTAPINPKADDVLVGQYGAVIDGTNVTQDWDVASISIIRGWNCTNCANVTVRNLVLKNLAAHNCLGFYNGSDGWTVEYNEMSGCFQGIAMGNYAHVSHNYVHDNSNFAMGGYLTVGSVIDSNEIAYSGGTPGQGGSTACTKWGGDEVGFANLTITNNYVHHCNTTGLWLDGAGAGSVIAYNTIENNVRGGIEWEVSLGGQVHHNTLSGNGVAIFVSNSQDVEVYENTITQQDGFALQLFVDASRLNVTNDYFHNNYVDLTAHSASDAVGLSCIGTTDCPSYGTPNNNRFDGNAYNTGSRTTSPFWTWGGSGLDWNGWRAIPEDATGSAQ